MNNIQNEIVVDAEILLIVADNEAQILLASSFLTILGARSTSGIIDYASNMLLSTITGKWSTTRCKILNSWEKWLW